QTCALPILLLDVADIAPVSLGYVTEECRALTQHLGIEVLGEIEVRLLGDPPQRGRLEDVDAGVDRVTEDLAPCRLLEEALDPAGDRKSTRLNSSHVKISYAV